jgi:4-hydroxybenzoate polyprenyltransferase
MSFPAHSRRMFDKINRYIDRLAHHPAIDRIESAVLEFRQISREIASRLDLSPVWAVWSGLAYHSRCAVVAIDAYAERAARSRWFDRLTQYALLIRFNKPIGTLLLLWPTLIALWIAAKGWPDAGVLFVFVFGVFLMRSAGCAINDYADRHIDGRVKRTKARPIASGKVSEKEALAVFAVLSLSAFALVLMMNTLTIWMSLAGIALAVSYPFMKRYHYLPQVHLGAAFGWAVPMAFSAQANEVTPLTWLLFLATVLWATVYDTMYAMVDRMDDIKIGVKSTAVLFGVLDRYIIGAIQAMLIFSLVLIGRRAELGGFYYAGVALATCFALWQQYLIRHRVPAKCFHAFLNNNWFGMVWFIGVVLDYQFGALS